MEDIVLGKKGHLQAKIRSLRNDNGDAMNYMG